MKFISSTASAFVPASHEDPRDPGVLKRVIATAADLQAGHVPMLNWSRLPAGRSFRPHHHEDMQEIFVVLSGRVTMRIDDRVVSMEAGDAVIVEPREVHEMSNTGETPAEFLVFGIASGDGGRTVTAAPPQAHRG